MEASSVAGQPSINFAVAVGAIGTPSGRRSSSPAHDDHRRRRTPSKRHSLAIQIHARTRLLAFLDAKVGSALKWWLRHFGGAVEERIGLGDIAESLRELGFDGDAHELLAAIDVAGIGELTLEAVDPEQHAVWTKFRKWCVETFRGSLDMLQRLGAGIRHVVSTSEAFRAGVVKAGWEGGCEDIFFAALSSEDATGKTGVWEAGLCWLDTHRREAGAKPSSTVRDARLAGEALDRFRNFLKRTYGGFIRAWLVALSPDGRMILPKVHFFRALSEIGCRGDTRLVWHALQKDADESIALEELHVGSAIILADFHAFVRQQGGAREAFRSLNRSNTRMLRLPEFLAAVQEVGGFDGPAESLFNELDRAGQKYLVEGDLAFLDDWKPPAYLLAEPNRQGMEDVKSMLFIHYGSFLKAWQALDVNSCNRCCWHTFQHVCQHIQYVGDIPGAWRALDDDISGYITLKELDNDSNSVLEDFRMWAHNSVGSVGRVYQLALGKAGTLGYRAFARTCHAFRYTGNARIVFNALDVDRGGSLSLKEVAFLDRWRNMSEDDGGEEQFTDSVKTEQVPSLWPTPRPPKRKMRLAPARKPLFVDRLCWGDLPHKAPQLPRKGAHVSSPVWCSKCRTRGPCRHMANVSGLRRFSVSCRAGSTEPRDFSTRSSSPPSRKASPTKSPTRMRSPSPHRAASAPGVAPSARARLPPFVRASSPVEAMRRPHTSFEPRDLASGESAWERIVPVRPFGQQPMGLRPRRLSTKTRGLAKSGALDAESRWSSRSSTEGMIGHPNTIAKASLYSAAASERPPRAATPLGLSLVGGSSQSRVADLLEGGDGRGSPRPRAASALGMDTCVPAEPGRASTALAISRGPNVESPRASNALGIYEDVQTMPPRASSRLGRSSGRGVEHAAIAAGFYRDEHAIPSRASTSLGMVDSARAEPSYAASTLDANRGSDLWPPRASTVVGKPSNVEGEPARAASVLSMYSNPDAYSQSAVAEDTSALRDREAEMPQKWEEPSSTAIGVEKSMEQPRRKLSLNSEAVSEIQRSRFRGASRGAREPAPALASVGALQQALHLTPRVPSTTPPQAVIQAPPRYAHELREPLLSRRHLEHGHLEHASLRLSQGSGVSEPLVAISPKEAQRLALLRFPIGSIVPLSFSTSLEVPFALVQVGV